MPQILVFFHDFENTGWLMKSRAIQYGLGGLGILTIKYMLTDFHITGSV